MKHATIRHRHRLLEVGKLEGDQRIVDLVHGPVCLELSSKPRREIGDPDVHQVQGECATEPPNDGDSPKLIQECPEEKIPSSEP